VDAWGSPICGLRKSIQECTAFGVSFKPFRVVVVSGLVLTLLTCGI